MPRGSLWCGFALVLVVGLAESCASPPPACSSANCHGCCTPDGRCEAGDSTAACGENGRICFACSAAEACIAGACTARHLGDAGLCLGCSSNGACAAGDTDGACGSGGAACETCSGGAHCTSNICSNPTCNGCVDASGACQLGTSTSACGNGGIDCRVCTGTQQCTNGQCAAPACNGCVDSSGSCQTGTSTTACGAGGGACQSCASGQQCTGGQCVTPSCSGCVDSSGNCQMGASGAACGIGGVPCQTCGAGTMCLAGSCKGGGFDGGAITCASPATYNTSNGGACGSWRWDEKTGKDPAAASVPLTPAVTTIGTLGQLTVPAGLSTSTPRTGPENTLWILRNITVVETKLEPDGDYHMPIKDPATGATMEAEIPFPTCGNTAGPFYCFNTHTRSALEKIILPTGSYQPVNQTATLIGPALFDMLHGSASAAPNGIEIHPVLGLCFGQDCDPTAD